MKAVIMVGGQGLRLRPLTEDIPKPLLPVGGKPLLFSIIEHLKKHCVTSIHLATNYRAELFEEAIGDGSGLGVAIRYSRETTPLGTAGPLKLIEDDLAGDEPFLVMNGDLLTTADISGMLAEHKKNGSDFTIGTRTMTLPLAYGVVEADGDDVRDLTEKPNIETEIVAGIYIMNPSVLESLPQGKCLMTDFIRTLIGKGLKVTKHRLEGLWIDIGQMHDYERAQKEAEAILHA